MVGLFYLSSSENDSVLLPKLTPGSYRPVITVGGSPVSVILADTPQERARGLSGRSALSPQQGMLFIFDKDDYYGIWMKDMNFAIDIVWIDAEGNIVDIKKHVTPESYPEVFSPKTTARYVLELPSDFTEIRNITVGGKVDLSAIGM